MRWVLFAILIFTLSAGLSYAQHKRDPARQFHPVYRTKAHGIGQYNVMLLDMLNGCEDLDLTDKQKKKIEEIRIKYLKPITEETTEYRKLRLSVYKSLQDPSFDTAKLKSELDKARALGKKMANQFVDGVSMLRDTLGPEKYKELNSASFRYRKDLIQLREKQLQRIKQSPPPAPENGVNADGKDDTGSTDKKE